MRESLCQISPVDCVHIKDCDAAMSQYLSSDDMVREQEGKVEHKLQPFTFNLLRELALRSLRSRMRGKCRQALVDHHAKPNPMNKKRIM